MKRRIVMGVLVNVFILGGFITATVLMNAYTFKSQARIAPNDGTSGNSHPTYESYTTEQQGALMLGESLQPELLPWYISTDGTSKGLVRVNSSDPSSHAKPFAVFGLTGCALTVYYEFPKTKDLNKLDPAIRDQFTRCSMAFDLGSTGTIRGQKYLEHPGINIQQLMDDQVNYVYSTYYCDTNNPSIIKTELYHQLAAVKNPTVIGTCPKSSANPKAVLLHHAGIGGATKDLGVGTQGETAGMEWDAYKTMLKLSAQPGTTPGGAVAQALGMGLLPVFASVTGSALLSQNNFSPTIQNEQRLANAAITSAVVNSQDQPFDGLLHGEPLLDQFGRMNVAAWIALNGPDSLYGSPFKYNETSPGIYAQAFSQPRTTTNVAGTNVTTNPWLDVYAAAESNAMEPNQCDANGELQLDPTKGNGDQVFTGIMGPLTSMVNPANLADSIIYIVMSPDTIESTLVPMQLQDWLKVAANAKDKGHVQLLKSGAPLLPNYYN